MPHALFRAFCLFIALFVAAPAHAQLKVDVTQGHVDPMEIAIPAFSGPNGADMATVIRANLESSGLFDAQDPAAFIERGLQVNATPRFADWRVIKSEALVVGAATVDGGRLRVDFRVWDVFGEEQLLGLQFEGGPDAWRRIAHKISDAIYERLTGLPGSFDTRVVFVSQSGGKLNRVKRLAIMDQDGANPSFLTDGSEQILNPRFSPSNQQIAYAALSDRGLKVWVLDIDTGRREVIAGLPGMSYAPRFSPDGSSVVLSGDADGNAEIYIKNLRSGSVGRLTNHPGIDTSPDISPDGSRIVFNSDRGGSPQLYVMARDGSGPRRISFGPGRYSTPVWSPNGELIAFTRQTGDRFQIGVMRADGSGERILSESYFEEGPTWASNSQSIMFTRENPDGSTAIWAVDVSGRNLRRVPAPGQALDPAWSPRLP